VEVVSSAVTEELESMARVEHLDRIKSKRKAIIALFPYAVRWERDGDHRMVDALLGVVRVPKVGPFMAQPIATLLGGAGPDFPSRFVTLMSPYADWGPESNTKTVTRWAAAALEVPYTEETGQSVVDTLLQIASIDPLTPHIPVDIWAWLKKRPYLPPMCRGRSVGTRAHIVGRVRELGDIEILESYFLLVWSEWDIVYSDVGLAAMHISILEDFGGIGMGRRREVLIKRLDRVLGQLDRGIGHLNQHNPTISERHIPAAREQYEKLKRVLLEVDREALGVLTRTSFRSINSFDPLTCPQNHTRHSFAPSLSHVRSRASTPLAPRSPGSVLHLHTGSIPPSLSSSVSIIVRLFEPHSSPGLGNAVSWLPR